MTGLENVLVKPLLTEKSAKETETNNRYAFVVSLKAIKTKSKQRLKNSSM